MNVLIIDNNDSFSYNLLELIRKIIKKRPDIISINELNIGDVQLYDKIILSPGPDIPKPNDNMAKVLEMYKGNKSILGVCLGCQAIAQFFGASLYNMPDIVHGMKRKTNIIDTKDYLYAGLGDEIDVGLYHSWTISKYSMPKELQITSISEEGIIMSISHTDYDIKGIQYHPESYMTKSGYQIMKNYLLNNS